MGRQSRGGRFAAAPQLEWLHAGDLSEMAGVTGGKKSHRAMLSCLHALCCCSPNVGALVRLLWGIFEGPLAPGLGQGHGKACGQHSSCSGLWLHPHACFAPRGCGVSAEMTRHGVAGSGVPCLERKCTLASGQRISSDALSVKKWQVH